MRSQMQRSGKVLLGAVVIGVVVVALGLFWMYRGNAPKASAQTQTEGTAAQEAIPVRVVKAQKGGIARVTKQPCTVHAFDFESLYAKVSGFLRKQKKDIGDTVKKDEVLAELYAPERNADLEHAEAALEQAKAQKTQMEQHVEVAKSHQEVAVRTVDLRTAEAKRAKASLGFRTSEYERVTDLNKYGSVDRRLVDEAFKQYHAAQAADDAAGIAILTAKADVRAKEAEVNQAKADLKAAEANVNVAKSLRDHAKIYVDFLQIKSHYDGVITARNYHNGDFIKSADQGASTPLFVIQEQDKMRVITKIPDADASLCRAGETAKLYINTLDGKSREKIWNRKFKVSRTAKSQNEDDRTLRVEVDADNKDGILLDGMFGELTIELRAAADSAVRIPTSAVRHQHEKTTVFVVRDNVAHEVTVTIGTDNGTDAEVLSGLHEGDTVINSPNSQIHDGVAVRTGQE